MKTVEFRTKNANALVGRCDTRQTGVPLLSYRIWKLCI